MRCGRVAGLRLCAALCLAALATPAFAGHYRWTTAGPEPGLISQIVVNPQNSDRLAAVAGYYSQLVFWTSDRGATWTQDDNLLFALRLVQDPSRANVLYTIGATLSFTGVLKTTDGGASWFPAHSGLPASLGSAALALAPSSPDTLYAVLAGSPGQVFRSLD